jgi:D-alanine--poly(phosphoribitol) ligase subunit 1
MSWMLNKIVKNFRIDNNDLCLCIDGKEYSYSDLTKIISGIQSLIKNDPESKIAGIVANNTPETYASIIACWLMGKGFVPIHTKYPKERNDSIIQQSSIRLILTSTQDYNDFLLPEGLDIRHTAHLNSVNQQICINQVHPEQTLCILFTSGSTGIPKGVPMTLGNIESSLDAFFALGYKLDMGDRFLQMFELTFDMSILSYLPAFILGASVYPVGSDKIRYLEAMNVMREQKITFAAMVPSTLALLRPFFNKISLPELKYSLLGGEPFYSDLAKQWMECVPNATVVNISGPTEITMACMGYELNKEFENNKDHNGILAFGHPWKNTTAILIDEDLNILGPEKTGELCFSGNHVMAGYLKQPELNKKVFFEKEFQKTLHRFYRTGDMAFMDKEGIFYSCGRKDLQVKIQGHKVELEEIEAVARKILMNPNVFALVIPDNKGSFQVCLAIEGQDEDKSELLGKMREKLPPYMIPGFVNFVNAIPYNQNGKIDRIELKKLF